MSVQLIVDPSTNEMPWSEFVAAKPPFSIAVDGFVPEGPRYDPDGPRLNLNHHEFVPRLETRASCSQARYHVQQGLYDRFRKGGKPHASVWTNDCDQDVCMAWTILSEPDVLRSEEFLRLLDIVDMRDTCGGFCAPPLRPEDGEALAWVFEPYQTIRASGGLGKRSAQDFHIVIQNVKRRMLAHLDGRGRRIAVDGGYRKVGGGPGWAMVEESSTDARMQMHADGIRVFASARRRPDGFWNYSVGRSSPVVPYPILDPMARLGAAERDPRHTWGGSDLIFGCNRVHGSSLSPDEVSAVLNGHSLRP